MKIDLERFHAVFFEEAAEHIATLEAELLRLEKEPDCRDLLDNIFRAAHSIKGSSGTFGFPRIAGFTHNLETLLDELREGRMSADAALVDLLLRAADMLGDLLTEAREGQEAKLDTTALTRELEAALGVASSAAAAPLVVAAHVAETTPYKIAFTPPVDIFASGMDPALLLRELATLGEMISVRVDASRLPPLADICPESCYLAWEIELHTNRPAEELADVFMFVADDSELSITPMRNAASNSNATEERSEEKKTRAEGTKPRSAQTDSIRVSVEKVEELINLVGELVIANSMVNESINELSLQRAPILQEAIATMERTTRELQEQVMAVRMMPIGHVFRRFPRLVRDLASSLQKSAEVEIVGEDTELDKQVIEEIGDPLTHLVRNAVDHGLESPEVRLEAGKPETGKVRLSAFHEGGNVIVEVADDGGGLCKNRIRDKAIAKGLIDGAAELTDEQIYDLIFEPGFSTAESVSDVSGRGVGMDVVKRNVEMLNGSVSIRSQQGVGTTFRVKLPLTMAILDGLSLSLDNEIYIVPLLSVFESIRPKPGEVRTVAGRGEVLVVRGETVPLLRLHRLFNISDCVERPENALVVILEHQGKKLGLMVDELLGQLQVVMKSLEDNFRKVEGISGATILGDGRVAFILDIPGLTRIAGYRR